MSLKIRVIRQNHCTERSTSCWRGWVWPGPPGEYGCPGTESWRNGYSKNDGWHRPGMFFFFGEQSGLLQLRIPPFFSNMQKRRGEFLAFLQIPKIFRLRRALRGYFNGFIVFSRYLARRRRKILRFYASRTRFPFTKPMVLLQNTQNFRLRRKSSDQSQIMQKRRGGILSKGGNS